MKSITLLDGNTGETVTFKSLTGAAAQTGAKVQNVHKLLNGAVNSLCGGRYTLADEAEHQSLYWRLYRTHA